MHGTIAPYRPYSGGMPASVANATPCGSTTIAPVSPANASARTVAGLRNSGSQREGQSGQAVDDGKPLHAAVGARSASLRRCTCPKGHAADRRRSGSSSASCIARARGCKNPEVPVRAALAIAHDHARHDLLPVVPIGNPHRRGVEHRRMPQRFIDLARRNVFTSLMISSLMRPVTKKKPSSSRYPRSPVRNHCPGKNAAAVASAFL